jgi:hypothetical protein
VTGPARVWFDLPFGRKREALAEVIERGSIPIKLLTDRGELRQRFHFAVQILELLKLRDIGPQASDNRSLRRSILIADRLLRLREVAEEDVAMGKSIKNEHASDRVAGVFVLLFRCCVFEIRKV